MKFVVQHLKYSLYFWISHLKDTLQKLLSDHSKEPKQKNTLTGSRLMREVEW